MSSLLAKVSAAMKVDLDLRSRVLLVAAVAVLVPSFFFPLWNMTFYAQQYPEGLVLYIYSHDLVGGDDGNDLTEINVLNHYIGMAELSPSDFTELKWIPLFLGLFGVLTLRAAAIGNIRSLVDLIVMLSYFGAFSLWSFWYKLSYYGSNLDPRASVKVEPFTPPVFGHKMVGQFGVWSYPSAGSYLLIVFGLLLVAALWLSWPREPKRA